MGELSIKRAALINFIAKYSNVLVQIIINSILARILSPDDYGIVAIITVFITFFAMLSDMGIGPAIIQYKDLKREEISDIFIFTFFSGIIVALAFIIFSYPLSKFYNNKVYIYLGYILSISILFNVLNIVPNALLLKKKEFKSLGIRTVVINIIVGLITIILGLNNFKYYALAINSVLVSILTFVSNTYHVKLSIYIKFNLESLRKIREFSSYQLGFNFVNYFSRNLDNLLIGKVLGQSALGYYDKSYRLMLYPVQNMTSIITPILHPILSEYQNERQIIYEQYFKIVKILSLIGIFAGTFCYFSSKEIVLIMFGEKWLNSVSSFKILSISIWPQMINGIAGSIFQATGEVKRLFKTGIINTVITVVAIILGVYFNTIEYVAIAVVVSFMLNLLIAFYFIVIKIFNRKVKDIFRLLFSSIIISAFIIILYNIIFEYIIINNTILSALVKFVVILAIYVVGLLATGEIKMLKSVISKG